MLIDVDRSILLPPAKGDYAGEKNNLSGVSKYLKYVWS
jgi:hypothetical protein